MRPVIAAPPPDEEFGEIPLAEPPSLKVATPAYRAPMSVPSASRVRAPIPPPVQSSRSYRYWLLLVLIPLIWTTVRDRSKPQLTVQERLKQTIIHHPEALGRLAALPEDASESQVFAALPNDRLDGALLAKETEGHWVLAAISGVGFLAAVLLLFPAGHAKTQHLIGIALLTGTLGILLLLAFQWLAFHMPLFHGRGYITLLLDFVWLIGQSYRMALGDHGFVLSFLGFTAGVGFCEEVCKALPVIFKARATGFSSWRSAMLWGMVSGVGFGISEGITYSSDSYNGIYGADMYWVRFVSCVGLHAIWAGAVGIAVFRSQDIFRGQMHPLEWIWRLAQVVIVPMILHGAYDTLLKEQADMYALIVAVVSFGWLAFQIERTSRAFGDAPPEELAA
jgi:RsiW-degrading membrane proteinase PrsW (M82 family)